MAIKSLEELRKIRENSKGKIRLRSDGSPGEPNEKIEILVGMATCGIAAGARDTLAAITQEIGRQNLDNVRAVPVGCIGYCKLEPMIMVQMPGEKPVAYGNATAKRIPQIIQSHIVEGKPVESMAVDVDFASAHDERNI